MASHARLTSGRDYGGPHQALRKQWAPIVAAGDAYCQAVVCLMSDRWIPPGTPWDLGHTLDRTGYHGPEHAKCNRHEGGRRGGIIRGRQRRAARAWRTSRTW